MNERVRDSEAQKPWSVRRGPAISYQLEMLFDPQMEQTLPRIKMCLMEAILLSDTQHITHLLSPKYDQDQIVHQVYSTSRGRGSARHRQLDKQAERYTDK
jgi:hypothetical protein